MPEHKLTLPETTNPSENSASPPQNGTTTADDRPTRTNGHFPAQAKSPVELKSPQLPLAEKTTAANIVASL